MIGILCWVLELGRIDIITEALILLSHNCSPYSSHLEVAYQIFEYFSHHNNGAQIVFDSTLVKIEEDHFHQTIGKKYTGTLRKKFPKLSQILKVIQLRSP